LNQNQIKELITSLGFFQNTNKKDVWLKNYSNLNDYEICLDFSKSSINYGKEIRREDITTSNFGYPENFVVLECVNRLLEKGYKTSDLTLEKKWKLGRCASGGKADIEVKGKDGETLIIIECKTWGKQYDDERKKMKQNGGQLFSYYQQEKNTKYLCLYTSRINKGIVEMENAIIKSYDSEEEKLKQLDTAVCITYSNTTNIIDSLKVWEKKTDKEFLRQGIFEDDIMAYNPEYTPIRIRDLKDFRQADAKKTYNQFEEILRRNNISDRSNAFNRFISLVLAKIVDEEKKEDEITDFQIERGIDDAESLTGKLQNLYSRAMRDYLNETVINYTLEEIEQIVSHFPKQTSKEELIKIFKELKFYTNNEFSFKEIYNKDLFEQNGKVLFEVVELFQNYRFKNKAKAQVLGDFFEDMLESGFKQSEGQFFTPTPIAKFIVSSIPLKEIIEKKINNKELKILPSVIDYACGSGHFITEAIEEIQQILNKLDDYVHKDIPELKKSTKWAGDYICGIEKDYRRARTSQVACFMHGDGDARIIFGDGLEKHDDKFPAQQFDVLVANPPYSIKEFKNHLNTQYLPDYDLYDSISDDSDDIEVLFVERTKQLLREGGYAGIFLPSSILTNTGIYTKAREILLKYFEIKAIVEFGSNTFSATGTNTIVLFMKRRSDSFIKDCLYIAEDYILGIDTKRENDFVDTKWLLKNYTELINVSLEDYKSLIEREPAKSLLESEFYMNYAKWFERLNEVVKLKSNNAFKKLSPKDQKRKLDNLFFDKVLTIEKEKFFYFLLTHRINVRNIKEKGKSMITEFIPQQTLIIKSGKENEKQKAFLGYTFSDKRGFKGIDLKKDSDGKHLTKLYDSENSYDFKKINYYINKSLNEEPVTSIDESLNENIFQLNLTNCINFERIEFDKQIGTFSNKKIGIKSKYPFLRIGEVNSLIIMGQSPEGIYYNKVSKGLPFYQGKIEFGADFLKSSKVWTSKVLKESLKDDILISVRAPVGPVNINPFTKICIGRGLAAIRCNNGKLQTKYLYSFLKLNQEVIRAREGVAFDTISKNEIKEIEIPVPPKDIQTKIINEIEKIEKQEKESKVKIEKLEQAIEKIIVNANKYSKESLGNIAEIVNGGTPNTKIKEYWEGGNINWATLVDTKEKYLFDTRRKITEKGLKNSNAQLLPLNTVIFSSRATIGEVTIAKIETCTNQGFKNFVCDSNRINY